MYITLDQPLLLQKNTVIDTMKIGQFFDQSCARHRLYAQQTRDRSITNISIALQRLSTLFSHTHYPHNLGIDPFRTFLCNLLHQYEDNTQQNLFLIGPNYVVQLY